MLSKLLRRLLALQWLMGALIGWLISRHFNATYWLVPVAGIGAPPMTLWLVILTNALRSRQPGESALWWRSVTGEYRACCRVYLLQQPWAKKPPSFGKTDKQCKGVPVVMVHGYLCNHRVWDAMAAQLQQAGHPVLAIDLEPLFTTIDDYSGVIEQAVTQLCQDTGAKKVALVGHSMGGLAIRAWMRAVGCARVARVITLGSPHQGTRIDRNPLTPNGQQMLWQSAWLKALAASESAQIRRLFRIAITPQDSIVYPQLEQVLPFAPVTVFQGLGHLELSQSRAVGEWVSDQLKETSPPP